MFIRNKKKKMKIRLVALAFVAVLVLPGYKVAAASMVTTSLKLTMFTDVADSTYQQEIERLADEGIVQGMGDGSFRPEENLTYAQAAQLMVNMFDLSLAKFTFIKAPQASDFFTGVGDEAWYSEPMMVAALNGVSLEQNVDPMAFITRDDWYYMLVTSLESSMELPMINIIPSPIMDDTTLAIDHTGVIQRGLSYGLYDLMDDGRINGEAAMSRGQAAAILVNTLDYMELHNKNEDLTDQFQGILNGESSKDQILLQFDLYNIGDVPRTLSYTSSQQYDFKVYDETGEHLYTWSADKMFMMALSELTIANSEYKRMEVEWDYTLGNGEALEAGSYKIIFESTFMVDGSSVHVESSMPITIE